ncbi:MAG: farnesyl diphosphate synthase [Moraxellaceae bacterium]|nr:polyprenyl synthetase family protein [Moraxellaceae bacterium]MDZ4297155.1 farnesyl diphosphate synthase [Moraxellaceae bacterium]MDZ4386676.1 farnesyl diphosphate synthase [Moraxellaceae bacterium]
MKPSLPSLLAHSQARFNDVLHTFLTEQKSVDARLYAAMHYAMSNGGKRVRPALAWGACIAVGGDWPQADSAALAVECIHGYSLVHDDLPCMDDDDLRRGKPTCHKQFDESTALLAGDALQALAFFALSKSALSADICNRQVSHLSNAAFAMVGGQCLDLAAEGQHLQRPQLEQIHRNKTGALIRAAASMGALAGNASSQQLQALDDFADALGLAFQVHDDVLDITSDTQTLGKTAGADIALAKATFPALLGLDGAKAYAQQLTEQALSALVPLGDSAQPLHELAAFLLSRDH